MTLIYDKSYYIVKMIRYKLSKLKLDKKLKLTKSKLLHKKDTFWHAISHNYKIKGKLGQTNLKIEIFIDKVKIDIERKL